MISAFVWKFFERLGIQISSFILTIILARLLLPEEYGLIALITVFIAIANVFVQSGFSAALIQKKNIRDIDYSSAMLISLIIAFLFYIILFYSAPFISRFYCEFRLIKITRILSLVLFPGALNAIQVSKLTREMEFKKLFICSIFSVIISSLCGIICASKGAGVWALVLQQLLNQSISCIVMYRVTRWHFTVSEIRKSTKSMFPYGIRILSSNLLVTIFMNVRSLIIGRVYSASDLGIFNRGKQFPQTIMESINGTIQAVLLPVYAREQDREEALKEKIRKSVRISNYLIIPLLFGLIAVGNSLVEVLLTDKWIGCVPYLKIFSISFMCQPTQIVTAQAMRAIGDSKTPLHIEIARKLIELSLLLFSVPFSVEAVAISSVISGVLSIIIAMRANQSTLKYSINEQIMDLTESIILSVVMFAIVNSLNYIIMNCIYRIIMQVIFGITSYLLLSVLAKPKSFMDVITILKRYFTH